MCKYIVFSRLANCFCLRSCGLVGGGVENNFGISENLKRYFDLLLFDEKYAGNT